MRKTACRLLCPLLVLVLFAALLSSIPLLYRKAQRFSYPQKYTDIVERWANEYDLDPLLIYAFIRTESGFSAQAQSNVDARGLMQITEETFDWIKSQIARSEAVSFEDLYDPETNIRFGCYYLQRCMQRYSKDISTAAAAYHSGWGTVDALLEQSAYSADGMTLNVFPYAQMQNYVAKICAAYDKYQQIYCPEGV